MNFSHVVPPPTTSSTLHNTPMHTPLLPTRVAAVTTARRAELSFGSTTITKPSTGGSAVTKGRNGTQSRIHVHTAAITGRHAAAISGCGWGTYSCGSSGTASAAAAVTTAAGWLSDDFDVEYGIGVCLSAGNLPPSDGRVRCRRSDGFDVQNGPQRRGDPAHKDALPATRTRAAVHHATAVAGSGA